MEMIEAKVVIGGIHLQVIDGQLLIYFPEGEGTSEYLETAYEKLRFITAAAKTHLAQEASHE